MYNGQVKVIKKFILNNKQIHPYYHITLRPHIIPHNKHEYYDIHIYYTTIQQTGVKLRLPVLDIFISRDTIKQLWKDGYIVPQQKT